MNAEGFFWKIVVLCPSYHDSIQKNHGYELDFGRKHERLRVILTAENEKKL